MIQADSRNCPVCDSANVFTVGPILHERPAHVAGVLLDLGNGEYWLRGCQSCGFQFKDPPIEPNRLMACYEAASSGNWEISPDPHQRQFDVLEAVVKRHASGRRILDIGCFNGALLNYFSGNWERFGIEPCREAAQMAAHREVTVLGRNLDELDRSAPPFDVILAIDVVEHIVDPMPFFAQVSDLLAPGGVFVILTGNNRALSWQLQRGNYWYSSLPEHVSFYSRKTLDWIGQHLGMTGVDYRRLCHKRLPLRRWIKDMVKSAAYVGGRKVRGLGIPALRRLFVERRGPTIQAARDHLIYVFRKN